MRTLKNTSDNIFTRTDLYHAFRHAFFLNINGNDIKNIDRYLQEWIDEYEKNTYNPPTMDIILKAVSDVMGVKSYDIIVNHRRFANFSMARHLCGWFMYMYTDKTVNDITNYLGYKNHSSVIHNVRTLDGELPVSTKTRKFVDDVKSMLKYRGYSLVLSSRAARQYKIEEV